MYSDHISLFSQFLQGPPCFSTGQLHALSSPPLSLKNSITLFIANFPLGTQLCGFLPANSYLPVNVEHFPHCPNCPAFLYRHSLSSWACVCFTFEGWVSQGRHTQSHTCDAFEFSFFPSQTHTLSALMRGFTLEFSSVWLRVCSTRLFSIGGGGCKSSCWKC